MHSSETPPTLWRPPARVSVQDVERWVEHAETAPSTEIQLSRLARTMTGAENLLQSAILRLERNGVPVYFSVPPLTFSGGRTARSHAIDMSEPMTPTEGLLADSIAGLTIALMCRPVDDDAKRATSHVRDRLREQRGLWGRGPQVSHVETQGIAGLRSTTWPNSRVASREEIADELSIMASRLLGRDKAVAMGDRLNRWALDFAFEALQNARTHGRVSVQRRALKSLRTLTIRRHNLAGRTPTEVLSRSGPHFEQYAKRVQLKQPGVILELTISDGGIGIPARMFGSTKIYSALLQSEGLLIQEAMWPGSTTDTVRNLESGEGFRKILRAAARLDGYFELRTGRHEYSRHFLGENGRPDSADFSDDRHTNPAYRLVSHGEKPYIAGTTLTLMFPLETS